MTLEFKNVSKFVDGQIHIHPTDLTLEKGTMNVLLGPTLSGKTSLMRSDRSELLNKPITAGASSMVEWA